MLDHTYKKLNKEQQEYMTERLALQCNSCSIIVQKVLEEMNPPIEIQSGHLMIHYNTWKRLKREIVKVEY